MFKRKARVPTTALTEGHLVWVNDGKAVDLGPANIEDFKILAFVAQEAYVRLPAKRNTTRINTLARVSAFCQEIYNKAKLTQD